MFFFPLVTRITGAAIVPMAEPTFIQFSSVLMEKEGSRNNRILLRDHGPGNWAADGLGCTTIRKDRTQIHTKAAIERIRVEGSGALEALV